MAEFSTPAISDLPIVTAETLQSGDPRVLGWLREAVQEGDRLNKADPSYERYERGLSYVAGDQRLDPYGDKIPYLPRIQINRMRKAMNAHVSALTDVKPLFGYKTTNDAYQFQADLLNQLTVAWWVNTMADLELGNCIKYALAGGTGDMKIEWDPNAGLGGDHALIACDARDTLPIRPSQQRSLQLWQGVTLREEHSINVLKALWTDKVSLFNSAPDTILQTIAGKFRSAYQTLMTPVDTLSGISRPTHATVARSGQTVLYRTYLNDQTRNLTGKPIAMGDATSNWSYVVQPKGFLYPRKRLVVWTQTGIVSDGPNPYWHGMYPIARLKLWELPWHFLGLSIFHDLMPMQDAITETANDIKLGVKQHMEPQVAFDRQAVSEAMMKLYDSRRPGAKLKLNPTGGEGFRKLDGPAPAVLQLGLEYMNLLIAQFDDLSGTANLQQLLELRQSPGAETIRAYYEALTPELRQEGRMIEAFLRDVGEMTKVNTFQFMSAQKRVALLGDAGLALEDFDYDPMTMVPALSPGDPGYTPELDKEKSRDARAQYFHKQFVFTVAPNSLLAMNAQEQKMLRLQLARMGYYDFWSLMESLEIPNIGQPPPMPLPPLRPPDPNEVRIDVLKQMGQQQDPQTGAALDMTTPPKYTINPQTMQVMEIRTPATITERLMAQQQLGIGMTVNPAGRKASGESMPVNETKPDQNGAPRQTVSESSASRNA